MDTSARTSADHDESKRRAGWALREMRRAAGLTQEDLSHRSGIAVTTLREYERGVTDPRITTLAHIVGTLDLEMGDFGRAYDSARPEDVPAPLGRPPRPNEDPSGT